MTGRIKLSQLDSFLDIVPDAALVVHHNGKILAANEQVSTLFGYAPDELLGRDIELLVPARLRGAHEKHRQEFSASPTIRPMGRGIDIWARTKTGHEFPAAIKLNPIQLNSEIEATFCIVRNLLDQDDARFRNLAHHVPAWVYILDLKHNSIPFFNRSDFLGYARSELSTPESIFKHVHREDWAAVNANLQQVINGEQPDPIEFRVQHIDGHWEWVAGDYEILRRTADGKPDQLLVMLNLISDRKRIEEALRSSESQFRVTWEIAADAMALSDKTGQLIAVNDAYLRLFGYSREEMLAQDFSLIFPEEEREAAQLAYQDVFSSPLVEVAFEAQIMRADGSMRFVESQIGFIEDETGHRTAMLSIVRDITDRIRAQKSEQQHLQQMDALRAISLELAAKLNLDELLKSIVNYAIDLLEADSGGLYFYRPEQDLLEWTVAVGPGLGAPGTTLRHGEGISGQVWAKRQAFIVNSYSTWPGRAPQFNGFRWDAVIAAPIQRGDEFLGVINVLANAPREFSLRDQDLIELFANQAAIAINNAQLYQQAQQEIKERRQAEIALTESLRLIRQAKLDWESTADSFDQIILLLAENGTIIRGNKAVESWGLGSVTTIPGHYLHEILHPDCQSTNCYLVVNWDKVWPSIIDGEQITLEGQDAILDRYLRIQIRPHQRLTGDQYGSFANSAVAVIQDLTEEKQVEERLLRTQKLESLGVMAGGVAHDFNNLLAAIVSESSLAQMRLPPGSPAYENIERAIQTAERAANLTQQLLAYSGRGQTRVVPLDLNSLILENLLLLESTMPRSIELVTQLEENLPPVKMDPGQIQQVVMNLLLNAAEAYEDQPGVVTITTETKPIDESTKGMLSEELVPGRYVCLSVSDAGHGIDVDLLPRIFDPFFTTKFTGRGLGLAAVSGIIRQHKGDIQVTSEADGGATFSIYLPASEEKVVVQSPLTAIPNLGQHTVLVIDDERVIRAAIGDFLAFYDMNVYVAENGQVGLATFSDHLEEIDLVILDLTMPVMSGKQTLSQIYKLRPEVPVIILSGFGESEAVRQLNTTSRIAFLKKPFRLSTLLEKAASLLIT